MSDKKRRATRRSVRAELDELRESSGFDKPSVTEVRINHVAVDVDRGVGVAAHAEYNDETGEWESVDDVEDYVNSVGGGSE